MAALKRLDVSIDIIICLSAALTTIGNSTIIFS